MIDENVRLHRTARRAESGCVSLLEAAEAALAAGFVVFPVHPRTKVPAVLDWEHRATRDVEQVRRWWRQRDWSIGIAAGPSDLLVIDLDPGQGATTHRRRPSPKADRFAGQTEVHGRDVLVQLAAGQGRSLLDDAFTYTVATPSGGWHLYFRQPAALGLRNSRGRLGRHIDTRGHGGYVLAAGSRGPGRSTYRVARTAPIAELPEWIATALTPPARHTVNGSVAVADVSAYVRAVVAGECDNVAAAPEGHRHEILLRAARRLGHWVGGDALSHRTAHTALTDAAQHFIGIAGYTARQVDRDITDGLEYGARLPRTTPAPRRAP